MILYCYILIVLTTHYILLLASKINLLTHYTKGTLFLLI